MTALTQALLMNTSSAGLQQVVKPDGSVEVDLQGRFSSFVLAKIGPDGSIVTECVTTTKEAEEFLNISLTTEKRAGLGHPEGFFAAFANLYTEVADAILAQKNGEVFDKPALGCPTVRDGAIGVRFVQATKESNAAAGQWTDATLAI